MGAFVDRNETLTIRDEPWEDWEEVVIGYSSTGEKDVMRDGIYKTIGLEGGLTETEMSLARGPVILAHARSWTFTKNGKRPSPDNPPMTVDRWTIGELEPAYSEFIYAKIGEFTARKSGEAQAAFFRATGRSLSGEQRVSSPMHASPGDAVDEGVELA